MSRGIRYFVLSSMGPLLGASLLLGGCATFKNVGDVTTAASQPNLTWTVMDERASATAELIYNFIAKNYLSAVSHGLKDPTKGNVKHIVQEAGKALDVVRAATKVKDGASVQAKYQSLLVLKADVKKLIPTPINQ